MKRPAFQFYPADWRKDAALQSCSIAAHGLWVNMLCIAHECEPYGHLSVNGKPMQAAQIGRLVGLSAKECQALLDELEDAGVFSRETDGTIYSRRMVEDENLRQVRAEGGKAGAEHGNKGGKYGVLGGRPKGAKKPPLPNDEEHPNNPPLSSSSSSSISSASLDFEDGAVDNPGAAPLSEASPPEKQTRDRLAHELVIIAQNRGVTLTSSDATCMRWAEEGVTPKQLADAIAVARIRKPEPATIPPGYLVPILEDIRNKTRTPARLEQPWYATSSGIEAKAREAGIDIPEDPSAWQGMKIAVYKRNGVTESMVRAAQAGMR